MLYHDPASHLPGPLILSLVPPGTQILCKSSVFGFLLLGEEAYPQGYPRGLSVLKPQTTPFLPIPLQPTSTLYSKPQEFSFSRFSERDLAPLKPSC